MAALYRDQLSNFLAADADALVGILAQGTAQSGMGQIAHLQVTSWAHQVRVLQSALRPLTERLPKTANWSILLEYSIPIIGRRPDAILLGDGHIFVLEYKAGATESAAGAFGQAQGYALDLQDFHEESRHRHVIPFAVGFMKGGIRTSGLGGAVEPQALAASLMEALETLNGAGPSLDPLRWDHSRYFAVPTLIEAAAAIYDHHDVRELSHSRAGQDNLDATLNALLEAARDARAAGSNVLCLVTGVPGSGKTLAGLNAISHLVKTLDLEQDQAAFLSGNNPLVKVLRHALALNLSKRREHRVSRRSLESVIQEMHRFVQDTYGSDKAPAHRAIVFDEAQRAWSRTKNLKKFGRNISEPEMVLEIMGRHKGWSLVVGLVGGGQEIHFGEAGLSAWGDALAENPRWTVWASPEAIEGGPSVAGSRLFRAGKQIAAERLVVRPQLHLAVPKRSYEAQDNAAWVNAILEGRIVAARAFAGPDLPVFVTRDLKTARQWLAERVAQNRRSGLVASSGAARLRADGVETPTYDFLKGLDYGQWFLKPKGDVRSSNQLEIAMSEFELQGLELDNVGLLWGGDLVFPMDSPTTRKFRGSAWVTTERVVADSNVETATGEEAEESDSIDQHTLTLNKYRVLMTRFRKAMVIFIPKGDPDDATRSPEEFDQIENYLMRCGARPLVHTAQAKPAQSHVKTR